MKSTIDQIAENLMTIQPLLFRSLARPARTKSSITPGGMYIMGTLNRKGTLSMSDIGNCLSMPKPHVTVLVDKLIDEGCVVRSNDPNDRRIINIALTDKGRSEFQELKNEISENLKEKLMQLDGDVQNQLLSVSLNMKDILVSILSKE